MNNGKKKHFLWTRTIKHIFLEFAEKTYQNKTKKGISLNKGKENYVCNKDDNEAVNKMIKRDFFNLKRC